MSGRYTIRPFETIDDYRACVTLQEETWGDAFSEQVPPAILKVAQILGGVSSGAYDASGRMVGFVFGMTGLRDGEVVHWSDMLAVRPEARDSGLGRQLKTYQRAEVLARGVEKMFWTFDPLQARNAHLNLTRLGAVVREYVENMYGDTDSPLHDGIGTDRFIALWLMDSERVRRRLVDEDAIPSTHDAPLALGADTSGYHPRPLEPVLALDDEAVRVSIPSDVGTLMGYAPELATEWRLATRAALSHYMARGYEVRELERDAPTSRYVLANITGSDD